MLDSCYNYSDSWRNSLFFCMANKPLEGSVSDQIPPATFKKCEKFTSSLTAGFFNELSGKAYQLGRQIDLVRGNAPELKCF